MSSLRPPATIASFLIIAILIPQSLFSQTASRPSQPRRRDDAMAAAIKELLKFDPRGEVLGFNPDPRAPLSIDEKASEDDDKPPADDAPIGKLLDYWSLHNGNGAQGPKPSNRVRQRLLEACEDRPESFLYPEIFSPMDCLPENSDTHDRLYKLLNEETGGKWPWKHNLQTWLRRNTAYFRDDLIKAAREADDHEYDANKDLRALARLDWNSARPILETLAWEEKAFVSPLALILLYEQAAQEGESALTESYRAILKAIVENRQANWNARVETLASLMNTEWSGQEEWFISLFANPTLSGFPDDEIEGASGSRDESSARTDAAKSATAADAVEVARDTGYSWEFQPGVLATVLYGNTVFRGNADRLLPAIVNLVGHNHRTIHKAAVKCLVRFLITESCAAAAEALTKYRDPRAIPALRRALDKEKVESNREKIVTALAECGGLSDDEMALAVEAYAKMVVSDEEEREIDRAKDSRDSDNPLPLKVSLGRILHESETIQATEGLAVRLIERAEALRLTQPAVSR